jgi:hypothetical protein
MQHRVETQDFLLGYVDALLGHVHAEGSRPKLGFWNENLEIDL